jgi:aryl-alcohol dehydrogenase-like predicted oxidoreductase
MTLSGRANLGKTPLRVTRIGCGLIRIGMLWGKPEKPVPSGAAARDFLNRAVELGVNFFDTAPSYGYSEKRLGSFLKDHPEIRSQLVIASKCGEGFDFERMTPLPRDYSPEAIRSSIEHSLEQLGPIDLMQIHSATPDLLETALSSDKGLISAIKSFQKTGDIKHIGLTFSCWDKNRYGILEAALKSGYFCAIQVLYNLTNMKLERAITMAAENQVGVIANRPLQSGELAARPSEAVRFLLDNRLISSILMGTASIQHLEDSLKSAGFKL